MALKRDIDSLVYSDAEEPPAIEPNKRQKKQTTGKAKRQPAVDPTYGQKWAFPVTEGLGAPSDDDLEFEDQTEALEYLRSVQQETSRIPHVVVAPKAGPQLPPGYTLPSADYAYDDPDRSIYHNGVGDSRGYYHDGAYTAAPDYTSSDDDDEEEEGELYLSSDEQSDSTATNRAALQEAYFAALTTRFTALRARLHQPPPQSALARLPPEHETHVASFAPKKATFRTWTHRLRHTDPLPAQVAAMDKTSVLRLLRVVLGAKFFRRGCALRARTSRWIWALLARLPDRGELDSDEVGAVRDLGKRAVLVSISREHVVALCEVLGREQVVAFGLSGVLHEIEGRAAEEREVDDVDGEGRAVNEDEISLIPDVDGQDEPQDAHPVQANGIDAPTQIDMDLEEGELSEDVQTASEPQPASADAAVADAGETDMDLEDGELSEEAQTVSEPPIIGADSNVVDAAETDLDLEEGEVLKEPPSDSAEAAAVAALKARLLSDLDRVGTWEETPATPPPAASKTAVDDPVTDAVNMRATVNMILTVAGEFYGQRDLLVFRDPFGEVPFETDDDDE